jgi:hypothetical protein
MAPQLSGGSRFRAADFSGLFSAALLLVASLLGLANTAVAARINYCDRAQAVANGTLAIRDALQGMRPTVAIYPASIATYMEVSATTGRPLSGFLYNVMERVAADGNFQWQ